MKTTATVIQLQNEHMHKCPRCRRITYSINYDYLCNRCVAVIVEFYPTHESVSQILENLKQRGLDITNNPCYSEQPK